MCFCLTIAVRRFVCLLIVALFLCGLIVICRLLHFVCGLLFGDYGLLLVDRVMSCVCCLCLFFVWRASLDVRCVLFVVCCLLFVVGWRLLFVVC